MAHSGQSLLNLSNGFKEHWQLSSGFAGCAWSMCSVVGTAVLGCTPNASRVKLNACLTLLASYEHSGLPAESAGFWAHQPAAAASMCLAGSKMDSNKHKPKH
jgi:hypothetical protein